jgi:osmotically-inducible protein OsmY
MESHGYRETRPHTGRNREEWQDRGRHQGMYSGPEDRGNARRWREDYDNPREWARGEGREAERPDFYEAGEEDWQEPRGYRSYQQEDSYGQPRYGQYGQRLYGQRQYGQGQYGQGQYGQRQYGQGPSWGGQYEQGDQLGQAGRFGRQGDGRRMSSWSQSGRYSGMGPRNYRRSDDRIKEDVSDRLSEDGELDASNIEVAVQNGEVTLKGTVEARHMKRLAEDLAEDVSGVKDVTNQIRVQSRDNGSGQESGSTGSQKEPKSQTKS